jgi:hypothetical protein
MDHGSREGTVVGVMTTIFKRAPYSVLISFSDARISPSGFSRKIPGRLGQGGGASGVVEGSYRLLEAKKKGRAR